MRVVYVNRRFWVVRKSTYEEVGRSIFSTKRRVSIAPGDEVIFYAEGKFWGQAIVKEVERKADEVEEKKTVVVKFGEPKIYGRNEKEEERSLDELKYSLLVVYRFDAPYRHFANAYRAIPQADYRTIVDNDPFLARTVVGQGCDALGNDHVREIKQRLLLHPDLRRGDYRAAWEVMRNYINDEILPTGELLVDSLANLQELVPAGLAEDTIGKIGFSDPDTGSEFIARKNIKPDDQDDLLETQAGYFKDLMGFLASEVPFERLEKEMNKQSEERYKREKMFERLKWQLPIFDVI